MGIFSADPIKDKDRPLQLEYARITREQFDDYRRRYEPMLLELSAEALDPDYVENQAKLGADRVADQFEVSRGATQRRLSRYGRYLTPAQERARERLFTRNLQSSTVDALNRGRLEAEIRQNALRRDLIGIAQGIRRESMGNLGAAANAENARNLRNQQRENAAVAGRWALLGTVLGTGASMFTSGMKKGA